MAKGSHTLFVDTTMQGVFLALLHQPTNQVLWRGAFSDVNGSAAALTPLVKTGLSSLGVKATAINHVVVSEGPGSFTGIKVGLAWVMGFAQEDCAVFGVSSFELAQKALGCSALFTSCTKSHGFLSYLDNTQATVTKLIAIHEDSQVPLDWPDLSHAILGGRWPALELWFQRKDLPIQTIEKTDLAKSALEAMIIAYQTGSLYPTTRLQPRYLRASTAEENLQNRS